MALVVSSSPSALLLVLPLLFVACGTEPPPLRPSQEQSAYHLAFDRPLAHRVADIPRILLDDLNQQDGKTNYANHVLTDDEHSQFQKGLAQLPPFLNAALATEVGAFYFVDHFAGAGFTYDLWAGDQVKFVLILNPQTFSTSLQDWLTYRDNTAFVADQGYTLREVSSEPVSELIHVLLHEASHVYDMKHHVTNNGGVAGAFSQGVWVNFSQIEPTHDFPGRSSWHFYDFEKAPKVPLSSLAMAFPRFESEVFASLYATGNAMEDFAEVIAYGTLKQSLGITVTLQLLKDGEVVNAFDPMQAAAGARFAAFVPE